MKHQGQGHHLRLLVGQRASPCDTEYICEVWAGAGTPEGSLQQMGHKYSLIILFIYFSEVNIKLLWYLILKIIFISGFTQ